VLPVKYELGFLYPRRRHSFDPLLSIFVVVIVSLLIWRIYVYTGLNIVVA
jgi:hypothetical protein